MNIRVASDKGVSVPGFRINTRLLKPVIFLACLIPLCMAIAGVAGNKFVDPVEALLHMSGEWGLRFLLITLCMTPAQVMLKSVAFGKFRRMLGLFAFFYTTLHLSIWVALDQGLDVGMALSAIVEKKYITVGIITWLALVPLAFTSNRFAVRKLGRKWKKLHSLIYLISVMAIVHYVWQVKGSEVVEPSLYLGALAVLLLWRFVRVLKQ